MSMENNVEILSEPSSSIEKHCNMEEFVVEKRIGRGQFSEVYRAIRIEDGQPVAIKKIHFYDMVDSTARTECLKEINLLQVIRNINYYEICHDLRNVLVKSGENMRVI